MDTRRVLTLTAVAGTLVVAAAFGSLLLRGRPLEVYYWLYVFHNGPPGIVLLWMSRLVLLRHPGNGAGLVLFTMGLVSVVHVAVAAFADLRLTAAGIPEALAPDRVPPSAHLPLDASIPLWFMGWAWVPIAVLAATMLPLLFPDGRLPGPRWRAVVVLAALGAALLMTANAVSAWPTLTWSEEEIPAWVEALTNAGWLTVLAAASASLVALGSRWRRAPPARRRQFQVVGVTAAVFVVVVVGTSPWQHVWVPAVLVCLSALFVAYALAVARYRLHDLEPVLGRAAVAAALSVLVTGVYLTVVVGVGGLVGLGAEGTLLPLVAMAAVALLFVPARSGARRLVDRLLYQRRADRTEVLSRLAARSSDSATAADVLGEVAELLVRGTGAARAEAALDEGPEAVSAGSSDEPEPVLRAAVAHRGERFGELRLYARAHADLVSDARPLLEDVAHALGVVLRNERLTEQLHAQLDDLRDSRQRLVEAHDRARRGLERDIHDGAQARLVAVRLRVGALHALARAADPRDWRMVEELEVLAGEVDGAVRSLRDLSRGVYPSMLEQSGLPGALRAFVRDLPTPVAVEADGVGRYPRAVEGAAYFCCLEAIQNAVRHSGARTVTVELRGSEDSFDFLVRDDGSGFAPGAVGPGSDERGTGLTNIDDRIRALGGRVRVDSAPGRGTRVFGVIPAQSLTEER